MSFGNTGWGTSSWGSTSTTSIPAAPSVTADQRDLYKPILMRRLLSHAYDRTRETVMANILSIIGEVDNDLGGLFDEANFLTDDAGIST